MSWNASDLDALEMEGGTAGRVLSNKLHLFESVVYCYLYHVRFHHPQRANAVLSCISISHCCDFEISNASKYDILKCLQVFHFA